ncbi:MAG TPA: gliding motility-associated C-terminal domain-containing protein, partial [Bacteroidetes bacterium]|nr:gliding motility-associated C-terminal domain-containing protein [Bacteroidota bacterium]
WTNKTYKYYKSDNFNGPFSEIASIQNSYYLDKNVQNGKKYCYKVISTGSYGFQTDTIINHSQISCEIPKDNEKPCTPTLSVTNNCDYSEPQDQIINHLSWANPNKECENTDDVIGYKIFFTENSDSLFHLLFEINDPDKTDTFHIANEFAGCYYIIAIDQSGNESEQSPIICAENCPLYQLPNTFTPNNDGENDIFRPILKRHITSIKMKVFNQWGIKVFETENPDINWDGTISNGKKLEQGTYYYICEPYSYGESLPLLKGFIEIIY